MSVADHLSVLVGVPGAGADSVDGASSGTASGGISVDAPLQGVLVGSGGASVSLDGSGVGADSLGAHSLDAGSGGVAVSLGNDPLSVGVSVS